MPIGGIVNLMMNASSKVVKGIIEKPYLLVFMIMIVLLFPLELLDYFLYYMLNFFIMILNVVICILVGLYNIIVGFLLGMINWVVMKIFEIINYLIGKLGFSPISTPSLVSFEVSYPTIAYKEFNLFGVANSESAGSVIAHNCLFEYILSLLGLSTPIW